MSSNTGHAGIDFNRYNLSEKHKNPLEWVWFLNQNGDVKKMLNLLSEQNPVFVENCYLEAKKLILVSLGVSVDKLMEKVLPDSNYEGFEELVFTKLNSEELSKLLSAGNTDTDLTKRFTISKLIALAKAIKEKQLERHKKEQTSAWKEFSGALKMVIITVAAALAVVAWCFIVSTAISNPIVTGIIFPLALPVPLSIGSLGARAAMVYGPLTALIVDSLKSEYFTNNIHISFSTKGQFATMLGAFRDICVNIWESRGDENAKKIIEVFTRIEKRIKDIEKVDEDLIDLGDLQVDPTKLRNFKK